MAARVTIPSCSLARVAAFLYDMENEKLINEIKAAKRQTLHAIDLLGAMAETFDRAVAVLQQGAPSRRVDRRTSIRRKIASIENRKTGKS